MDSDRLFPADPTTRAIARELYAEVCDLPLISPHGHVDPALFANDERLPEPTALFVAPDHYLTRMLYSQGITQRQLGVPDRDGQVHVDPREAWRTFCEHWYLFRGTPSKLWLEQSLDEIFGVTTPLGPDTADAVYDELSERIAEPAFRPRALLERFGIEVLATTESATDSLEYHAKLAADGWGGPEHRIIPTLRPDGDDPRLRLVLFTLDETAYSRELAPLAGLYPAVYVGPAWWFYDSPEGMRRYREMVTETAGFYNTVGFTDDTRAFPSIPVRHDVARRIDCGFLAKLVAEHRLLADEAAQTAKDLAYRLPKRAYRLD